LQAERSRAWTLPRGKDALGFEDAIAYTLDEQRIQIS
jgi:hypothetical protein